MQSSQRANKHCFCKREIYKSIAACAIIFYIQKRRQLLKPSDVERSVFEQLSFLFDFFASQCSNPPSFSCCTMVSFRISISNYVQSLTKRKQCDFPSAVFPIRPREFRVSNLCLDLQLLQFCLSCSNDLRRKSPPLD